jgi:UDP-glucose 4-epimerase
MSLFQDKVVVVTGGTGSVGQVLTTQLLSGIYGQPKKVIIFSRDESKQHAMRVAYQRKGKEVTNLMEFRIGDVRDFHSVSAVLRHAHLVIHTAAMKQVPSCEYFPYEAVQTNITGAENIVRAIHELQLPVEAVVSVSTDKAAKPVNVMGMTKALQERIFIAANILSPQTRFVCVRFGNVLASRGSVIPLFREQIQNGGPVTVTSEAMTRFLLPLDRAVETIVWTMNHASRGEIIVPKVPAARMINVAQALIDNRDIAIQVTGIRPGEKTHEMMVSEEEAGRTLDRGNYYAIQPMLPELIIEQENTSFLQQEYISSAAVMTLAETHEMLYKNCLLIEQDVEETGELLR